MYVYFRTKDIQVRVEVLIQLRESNISKQVQVR